MNRKAIFERNTKETKIKVAIKLDDGGAINIDTGVGFFDHMLTLLAFHSNIDLEVIAKGDLYVDDHHMVEDVGIALGTALKESLGTKERIKRYGTSYVPMDEALAFVTLDFSGRSYLVFQGEFNSERAGNFSTEMVEEFFRALAFNAGITLHCNVLYGKNDHHKIEALFKAFGRAMKEAITIDESINGVLSSKGVL